MSTSHDLSEAFVGVHHERETNARSSFLLHRNCHVKQHTSVDILLKNPVPVPESSSLSDLVTSKGYAQRRN